MGDNVQREILESSYDILPEDEPRFEEPAEDGLSPRDRAHQLYGGFSDEEKTALLEQKLDMLRRQRQLNDDSGKRDVLTQRLYDMLSSVQLSKTEGRPRRISRLPQEKHGGKILLELMNLMSLMS